MIAELDHTTATGTGLERSTVVRTQVWGLDLSGTPQGAGGVGGLLAVRHDGQSYAPLLDGNGNVMGLVGLGGAKEGQVVARYDYDAFGNRITNTAPELGEDANPFGFSTKFTDEETGLVYYGYRYYDPVTGRWLGRDPIGEEGGLNLYGMVGNDAVNRVDYLGLFYPPSILPASALPCCGEKKVKYQPILSCCIDGELVSRKEINTGVNYDEHKYPGGESPVPWKPSHVSVGYPGGSVGAYPGRGGAFGGPGGEYVDNDYGRELESPDSAYDMKGCKTKSKPVKLSPCLYDIEKFVECVRSPAEHDFRFGYFFGTNDCRHYAKELISRCKTDSKR